MKTFFKHLSIQLFILLSIGVGYAAWNTLVVDGETLTATKWNDVVNQLINLSEDVSFSVSLSSTQTGLQSVWTELDWQVEQYDTTSTFNLSTNRFQPTIAGKYLISANIACIDLQLNNWCSVTISKNGATVAHDAAYVNQSGAASFHSLSTVVELNGTSDYISGYFNTNDSTPQISGGTKMEGFLLSR